MGNKLMIGCGFRDVRIRLLEWENLLPPRGPLAGLNKFQNAFCGEENEDWPKEAVAIFVLFVRFQRVRFNMEFRMSLAKEFRAVVLVLVGLVGLLAAHSVAADRALGGRRSYAILDRFKQALTHVTLTDDEKPKVDTILQNAANQADDLARHTEGRTLAERQQALGDFAREIHQQLGGVLTIGQMQTLQLYLGPGPSSRPTTDDFSGGAMWTYLPKAIAKMDLSSDQLQQIRDLMQSSRQKAAEIRSQTDNGGVVFTQMQQLRQDVKTKLQAILTPDQMQTLVQTMQQMRENRSGATTQPQKPSPDVAADPSAGGEEADQSAAPAAAENTSPDIGAAVPDVKIAELNGHTFIPANYKGHVLVLEFGSMSCPVFRDHVQEMEKLRASEGPRAFFLLVYTREAFPAGDKDVQRNKDQGISVSEATTLEERKTQAQMTEQSLQITMAMAVDSMDDAVSKAFGTFPNGAVVIGKDGKIAALEHWSSADSLRRAIDAAYQAPSTMDH